MPSQGRIPSNFAEKSAVRDDLVAFDEAVDIVRRHTTPSHRWRALARALEASAGLQQDPPPICGLINDACDEGGGAVRVRGLARVPRPLGAWPLASALGLFLGSAVACFAGRLPFSCWCFSAITRESSSRWRLNGPLFYGRGVSQLAWRCGPGAV